MFCNVLNHFLRLLLHSAKKKMFIMKCTLSLVIIFLSYAVRKVIIMIDYKHYTCTDFNALQKFEVLFYDLNIINLHL